MPTPSSQGSSVSFAGVNIGRLTSFKFSPGNAVIEEATSVVSPVIGTGGNARIVKQYDCVAIDPGSVDIGLFGSPPFLPKQTGLQGTVSVTFNGSTFSINAYLDSFDVTGNVGEFLVGTARFRISGLGWSDT